MVRANWVRSAAGALAVAVSSMGCSRVLPHDFDPRKAYDVDAPNSAVAGEAAELAVLLVPSNTTLSGIPPARGRVRSSLDVVAAEIGTIAVEQHFGPVRIFLPPGKSHYKLTVQVAGGVAEFELEFDLRAGKQYELTIVESGFDVAFDVYELHPSTYAALYPNG
jgi:hypothetical protein